MQNSLEFSKVFQLIISLLNKFADGCKMDLFKYVVLILTWHKWRNIAKIYKYISFKIELHFTLKYKTKQLIFFFICLNVFGNFDLLKKALINYIQ